MKKNQYDEADRVRQEALLAAGGIKLAAYRVRDPETDEWGRLQFHMTYNDTVLAVMSEEAARLFARFVRDNLPQPGRDVKMAVTVWKDGTWKAWQAADAQLAEGEDDWLSTVPLPQPEGGRWFVYAYLPGVAPEMSASPCALLSVHDTFGEAGDAAAERNLGSNGKSLVYTVKDFEIAATHTEVQLLDMVR